MEYIANDYRSSNYLVQFIELFTRITMITVRSPTCTLGMMGIGAFVGWLLVSVYSSVPIFEMDFSDITESKKAMRNWIGFAAYLN